MFLHLAMHRTAAEVVVMKFVQDVNANRLSSFPAGTSLSDSTLNPSANVYQEVHGNQRRIHAFFLWKARYIGAIWVADRIYKKRFQRAG